MENKKKENSEVVWIMTKDDKMYENLPVVRDSASITKRSSWRNGEIMVAETGINSVENLSEFFRSNHYAMLLVTQGTLKGRFNMVDIEMKAPAAVYIFNDHVLHYDSTSPDLKVRLLSYSPVIAEELSLSYDKVHYAYARPAMELDETSMRIIILP